MKIWFHGTDEDSAKKILAQGFQPATYFAAHLEDAIAFGGPFVFEVALNHRPRIDGDWQMCVGDAIGPKTILSLTHYRTVKIANFPERRKAVFDQTMSERESPWPTDEMTVPPAP